MKLNFKNKPKIYNSISKNYYKIQVKIAIIKRLFQKKIPKTNFMKSISIGKYPHFKTTRINKIQSTQMNSKLKKILYQKINNLFKMSYPM